MRPGPAAPERGPTGGDRARRLFGGRYTALSGHCIYCGAFSWGRLCRAHTDLPPLDPPLRSLDRRAGALKPPSLALRAAMLASADHLDSERQSIPDGSDATVPNESGALHRPPG